jgi:FkbM family methyltransferase
MSLSDRDGNVIECPDNVDGDVRAICEGGEYEIPVRSFDRPPHVLDIGANVGAFACWISRRAPGCTIDCYEPSSEAFRYLEQNVPRLAPGAKLHHEAIHDHDGTAPLYRGVCGERPDGTKVPNICCNSLCDIGSQDLEQHEAVKITDAKNLPACNILKVDTEGSEIPILSRYFQTHKKTVAIVLVEVHSRTDRRLVENLLEEDVGMQLFFGHIRKPNLATLVFMHRQAIHESEHAR